MTDGGSVLQIRDGNRVIHTPTTDPEARKDQRAGLMSTSDQGLLCADLEHLRAVQVADARRGGFRDARAAHRRERGVTLEMLVGFVEQVSVGPAPVPRD